MLIPKIMDSSQSNSLHHRHPLLIRFPNPFNNRTNNRNPHSDSFNLDNSNNPPPPPKPRLAMEKFREIVMKLANSNPNKEITETQKRVIQEKLTDFFSDFHTPDHPPYSAMIQRAIKELNEKRGSSEESISKFLKTEYHDLPWAHFTLLKHHLVNLCDSGEIIVTRGQRYLLPGVHPNMNLSKKRKKGKLKRRDWGEWWNKRRKCQKKIGTGEEIQQKEDQVLLIEIQNKCNEDGDEVIGKQNPTNKENGDVPSSNLGWTPEHCDRKKASESEPTTKAPSPIVPMNLNLHKQEQYEALRFSEWPCGEEIQQKDDQVLLIEQNKCNGEGDEVIGNQNQTNNENGDVIEDHSQVHQLPRKVNCDYQKASAFELTTKAASPIVPTNLNLLEQEQHTVLHILEGPSEIEPITVEKLATTLQQKTAQEKPPCRILRPRPLKTELITDASMTASLRSQHLREVQQQPEHRGRGRHPTGKLETAATGELLFLTNWPHGPQQEEEQQLKHRRRGRPRKIKLETAITEEVLFLSNSPHDPLREEQQLLEKEKPQRQGRGRPRKPIPATLPSEKQQQPANTRGRTRTQKMDQREIGTESMI